MGYHTNKSLNESSMQEISRLMQEVEKASDLKRLQCVYLRAKGASLEEISDFTQYSISHIKRVWTAYFSKGIEAFFCKPRGGRHRFNLDLQQEAILLEKHSEQAGEGRMLKMTALHQELCEIAGRKVAPSTAYRIAKRHGWGSVRQAAF